MAQSLASQFDETMDEGFVKGMRWDWQDQAEAKIEEGRAKLAALKSQAKLGPIEHCIDRFVRAEADFTALGDRGIGRVTLSPPRLGGHLRKHFRRLSEQELVELIDLIRCLVFRGYVIRALMVRTFDPTTGDVQGERLFDEWIGRIYVTHFDKQLLTRIYLFGELPLLRLKDFLVNKNAVGGGLFSKDKTSEIIFWYLMAGYLLRQVEGIVASSG